MLASTARYRSTHPPLCTHQCNASLIAHLLYVLWSVRTLLAGLVSGDKLFFLVFLGLIFGGGAGGGFARDATLVELLFAPAV